MDGSERPPVLLINMEAKNDRETSPDFIRDGLPIDFDRVAEKRTKIDNKRILQIAINTGLR